MVDQVVAASASTNTRATRRLTQYRARRYRPRGTWRCYRITTRASDQKELQSIRPKKVDTEKDLDKEKERDEAYDWSVFATVVLAHLFISADYLAIRTVIYIYNICVTYNSALSLSHTHTHYKHTASATVLKPWQAPTKQRVSAARPMYHS